MAKHQTEIKDRGIADFDGLSPSLMDVLFKKPLSDGCKVEFRKYKTFSEK